MPHDPKAVAAFARNVRKLRVGSKVLAKWLGDGGYPVPVIQANSRAMACAGCKYNVAIDWPGWIKQGAAETILLLERLRHDCSFQTIEDDSLGECDLCLCYLKLKVWCPLDYIEHETKQEDLTAFPAHCWIRKEMEEHERDCTIQ